MANELHNLTALGALNTILHSLNMHMEFYGHEKYTEGLIVEYFEAVLMENSYSDIIKFCKDKWIADHYPDIRVNEVVKNMPITDDAEELRIYFSLH